MNQVTQAPVEPWRLPAGEVLLKLGTDADLFANGWLWAAVGLSLLLHAAVLYVPFLQQAFSTEALDGGDWLVCVAVASSVLWLRELGKLAGRVMWPEGGEAVAGS